MRRISRQIRLGTVLVGGGAPVSIQTMAKARPDDVETIVEQLTQARMAGCHIARIAVPHMAAARTIPEIRERSGLPVVADVHFDHRLAVEAARQGADGLRVNPGNLGGPDKTAAVVEAAQDAGIPIRVGVNAGSLPKTDGRATKPTAEAMVEAGLAMTAQLADLNFSEVKVSLKAHDGPMTIAACRLFAQRSDLPLHLGVTEAGPPLAGAVRSAAALSQLLAEGLGDTLRISLSGPPVQEVRVARYLLQALGLLEAGTLVSCPTCGRTTVDLCPIAERVEQRLEELDLPVTVAVMGCEVNGPGEARAADVGIAFGPKGRGALFAEGQVEARLPNGELEAALISKLEGLAKEDGHGL